MKFLDKNGVPLSVGDYVRFVNRIDNETIEVGQVRKMIASDATSRIDLYKEDAIMTYERHFGNQWRRASSVEKLTNEEALLFKLENF